MDRQGIAEALKALKKLEQKSLASQNKIQRPDYLSWLESQPWGKEISQQDRQRLSAENELWYSDDAVQLRMEEYGAKVFKNSTQQSIVEPKAIAEKAKAKFLEIFGLKSFWDLPKFQRDTLTAMFASHLGLHPDYEIALQNKATFNMQKGVFVAGRSQIGKTTVFLFLKHIQGFSYRIVTGPQLVDKVERLGSAVIEEYSKGSTLVIDEIGWEQPAMYMGNLIDVIPKIIHNRHAKGLKTHMTSNMSIDALAKRYEPHIITRIEKCCNIIYGSKQDKQFLS